MADYKEVLTGTFGKLADRVKDAADGSGLTGIYARGADRARAFGQITRLTLAINGELSELDRVFTEIGRLYYEQAKAAPDGFFVPLFEQAGKLSDSIRDKRAEVDSLRASYPDYGTKAGGADIRDFDDIVSAAEREAMNGPDRPE